MKKLKITLVLASLLASLVATQAHAVVFNDVGARERAALQSQVATAKAASPKAFAQLHALRTQLPELDKHKRGRAFVVVPRLAALGPEGLFPMLEALSLSADAHADLSDEAYATWRAGLIEAVGRLRDARALAHLKGVLLRAEGESARARMAAGRAIGQLRSDDAMLVLQQAQSGDVSREAAAVGLGEMRTPTATALLGHLVEAQHQDTPLLRTSLKALGQAGSSWAWDTLGGATSGEGDKVRQLAALSLVQAWARLSGEAREEAVVAMSMTEYRELPAMIESLKGQKGVDSEARSALLVRIKALKLR